MATAVETTKIFMDALKSYAQDNSQVGRIALDDATRKATTYSDFAAAVEDLKEKLKDTTTYPDTDTRLREATGIVIGAENDYEVDTGAISGYNAGGSTVKNSHGIVPENGTMSDATLPEPGSTTPITYTGEDGKSFTFYVKWPDSFSTVVQGPETGEGDERLDDSRYQIDLNTLDENAYYTFESKDSDGETEKINSPTYGQMKNSILIALKGLNTWWLRESAKLNYDSLGLALDGQTIEIKFVAGGNLDDASAVTYGRRKDSLPSDFITLAINIQSNGRLDSNDAGGLGVNENGKTLTYLDRVVAHEMVHAVMFATGTLKENMPQFFTEGIADLVQGDDDHNSGMREHMIKIVNDSDTLAQALNYEPGTGSTYAYPAGDMLMRFLAKQNLNTTMIIADPNQAQTFDYNGNNEVISNFTEADRINYNANFTGAGVSDTQNDFVASALDGNELVIRDARGKLVTMNIAAGNAYAYMANESTEVDGRNINGGNGYDIFFGANYGNDILRAGNAGSYLWGGERGNDELFGGAGQDTFVYGMDGGKDTVNDAESQDKIYFKGMTADAISAAQFTDNGIYFAFTDGGNLNVNGKPSTVTLEDSNGTITTYRADYENKNWTAE